MPEKKHAQQPGYYLGLDGGGTKTDCVLVDSAGEVLARATAGPSNPLRAGYAKAWFALSDAADVVLERQHLKADDIHGICAGIGGAGRESVARRIATFLERGFPQAAVSITTDLAITLHAAVGDKEGIILVVGTGSGAYGRDAKGHTARAGGRSRGSATKAVGLILAGALWPPSFAPKKNAGRKRLFRKKCLPGSDATTGPAYSIGWSRIPMTFSPAFFRSLLNWAIKATLSRAKFYPPPPIHSLASPPA